MNLVHDKYRNGISLLLLVGLWAVITFLFCVSIYTTVYTVGQRIKHHSQTGKLFYE